MSKADPTARKYGGVSPRVPSRAPLAAAAGARADFVYNGGPVIRAPQVYISFWGSQWTDGSHAPCAARLEQFMRDLLNSQYMNVLSQYGVGSGAGAAVTVVATSFASAVPAQLDENAIGTVIQGLIDAGELPDSGGPNRNTVLVIYLDETVAVNQPGLEMCEPTGDNAFGFHFDFVTRSGNEFYYAIIPALDNSCLQHTCPNDGACSLHQAQTQEQRLTQVTSHEFAEMCTDPKFTTGWYGPTSDENGDVCNGQSDTITVGGNTWNVQRQYSKTDDENTGGANYCVVGAASPLARRPDGPRN